MDSNGLRTWMLADEPRAEGGFESHWELEGAPGAEGLEYDQRRRCLRLVSRRAVDIAPSRAEAEAARDLPPRAVDRHGAWAVWIPTDGAGGGEVRASAGLAGRAPVPILAMAQPQDLAVGPDGDLYASAGTTLRVGRLADLSNLAETGASWRSVQIDTRTDVSGALRDFEADRLAPRPEGGAWMLDRTARKLALLELGPAPPLPRAEPVERFRPAVEARLRLTASPAPELDAGEELVDLDVSPRGLLALLSWSASGAARLRVLDAERRWSPAARLAGLRFAHSLAWLDEERVALLAAGAREAPVYRWRRAESLHPVGDRHPLRDHDGAAFLHGPARPPVYWSRSATEATGGSPERLEERGQPRRLRALSLPSHAREGSAGNTAFDGRGRIDGGDGDTVWHRLYLEAVVPPGAGLRVELGAVSSPGDEPEWHPHVLGEVPSTAAWVPRAARLGAPSERPFHPGFIGCAPGDASAGCFTVLVQRGTRRTRALRGRYLRVRVTLFGDGRSSPQLHALRVYGSRFSYVERYLPELYHETLFGPEAHAGSAEQPAASTPADFLERFVDNFEGVLTPIEDRIAAAHLLTTPAGAPAPALGWLASWLGLPLDAAWDESVARGVLRHAAELSRWHGTRYGLELLTNLVLPGAVGGGRVVFLEGWQLRRTFATILGADLADEEDALVGAVSVSGNSKVGDTLVLGDAEREEFLALFSAGIELDADEAQTVGRFFREHAHRLLAVVASDMEPRELELLERVLALEVPAHVRARIAPVTQRLRVGLSSLVGVDTRLEAEPPPRTARIGASSFGGGDRIGRPASLDPRIQGDVE